MRFFRSSRLPALPARPLLLTIALFYLFGVGFHLLPATRPYMTILTPYVLFGVGLLVLYPVVQETRRGILLWGAASFLVTFFLEALGVATGAVFGEYEYGSVLGAKLVEVPPVIGFNWVLVLLGCVRASRIITSSALMTGLLTGIAAMLFDIVMEPVAISQGYWSWRGEVIPLQNYAAWFCIAAAAGWAYRRAGLRLDSTIPSWYVVIQLGFFAGLRLTGAA